MPHFRLALLVMSLKRTSRPTSFSQFVRFCEGTSTSHRRYNERRQQTQFFLTMLRETQLAPAPLTSTQLQPPGHSCPSHPVHPLHGQPRRSRGGELSGRAGSPRFPMLHLSRWWDAHGRSAGSGTGVELGFVRW